MAIYHLNVRAVSRGGSGRGSSFAKMSYITRTGIYKGYDQRVDDIPSEFVKGEAGNMPSWVQNYKDFWKSADKYERANARLAQEVEIALPVELNQDQQVKLVRAFVVGLCGGGEGAQDRLPYTWAIHKGKGQNPHAHILFSERINDGVERPVEQWFRRANPKNPELGGTRKARHAHEKDWVQRLRDGWAWHANTALKEAGLSERIDPRSHLDRKVAAIPGRHRGPRFVTRSREMDPLETYLDVDHHNATRDLPSLALADLYAKLQKLEQDKAARMGLTLPLEGQKAPERGGGRGGR